MQFGDFSLWISLVAELGRARSRIVPIVASRANLFSPSLSLSLSLFLQIAPRYLI